MTEFKATNEPGTCLWCGRKLRPLYRANYRTWHEAPPSCRFNVGTGGAGWRECGSTVFTLEEHHAICERGHRVQATWRWEKTGRELIGYGPRGDGFFDTLECSRSFALVMAGSGRRLKPGKKAGS